MLSHKFNEKILCATFIENQNDWNKTYEQIVKKNYPTNEEIDNLLKDMNLDYITILDNEHYPEKLKKACQKPPFVLFYKGDLDILTNNNETKLVVLGNEFIKEEFEIIIQEKLEGITFVLYGDNELNDYIISNYPNNKMIVIKTYINNNERIRDNMLVISENQKENYNLSDTRIIAGICDKALVLRCSKRSYANMVIVNLLMANYDIMVMPTPIGNENYVNNTYIYEGATPIVNYESLKFELSH